MVVLCNAPAFFEAAFPTEAFSLETVSEILRVRGFRNLASYEENPRTSYFYFDPRGVLISIISENDRVKSIRAYFSASVAPKDNENLTVERSSKSYMCRLDMIPLGYGFETLDKVSSIKGELDMWPPGFEDVLLGQWDFRSMIAELADANSDFERFVSKVLAR